MSPITSNAAFYQTGAIRQLKQLAMTAVLFTGGHTNAQFSSPLVLDPALNNSTQITVADINNDNNDDIIVTRQTGFERIIQAYLGDGHGNFTPPQTLAPNAQKPQIAYFADLNNNGQQDMIVIPTLFGNPPGTDRIAWFPNNSGTFQTRIVIDDTYPTAFTAIEDIRIVDVENDGDLDIIAAANLQLTLYTNDGSANFTQTTIPIEFNTENYDLDVADFNSDGFIDIIIGGVAPLILINTNGSFAYDPDISSSIEGFPGLTFLVYPIDFDNDGDQDLILADTGPQNLWLYEQGDDGLFNLHSTLVTNTPQSFSMTSADFDNDGDLDLLTNFPQLGQTVWFENDNQENYQNASLIHQGITPFPKHVATGDFNNDNIPDAVWSMPLSVHLATTTTPCTPDLTGDNLLNFFDISAFLDAFGIQDPAADFTNDGTFNFFDVSAFLQAFAQGCP